MDKFDLKKYIAEGKLLKKEISENEKYEPFEEGETFLRRSEFIDRRRDYQYLLKSQEEYDYLLKFGPLSYESEYLEDGVDELVEDYEEIRKEEYSLGNDDFDYNLPQIQEDQSTNQLKEDTSKYKPFEKGKTVLRRTEFIDRKREYDFVLENQEQYDFLLENGLFAFEEKYVGSFGIDEIVDDSEEVRKEEFSLGNNEDNMNLIPINENKSTNQIKIK